MYIIHLNSCDHHQVDGDGLDSLENSLATEAPSSALTEAEAEAAGAAGASPKRSPFSEPVLHQEQEEPLVRSASAIETRQKLPCQEATWEKHLRKNLGRIYGKLA